MLCEGCETQWSETRRCYVFVPAHAWSERLSVFFGDRAFGLGRSYFAVLLIVLSLVLQVLSDGTVFGGCSMGGGAHWVSDGLPSGSSAFSSLVSVPVDSAVSTAGRSASVVARPVVRPGELSLKFYLRYEGGQFWWTLERPVPSCSGTGCGSKSSMEPAIVVDFQSRTSMTPVNFSLLGLCAVSVGRGEGVYSNSVKAERGGIEVTEPPPRRFL